MAPILRILRRTRAGLFVCTFPHPCAPQHFFRWFALNGEISVGRTAAVRIGEPVPNENAGDCRTIEGSQPIGDDRSLQGGIFSQGAAARRVFFQAVFAF